MWPVSKAWERKGLERGVTGVCTWRGRAGQMESVATKNKTTSKDVVVRLMPGQKVRVRREGGKGEGSHGVALGYLVVFLTEVVHGGGGLVVKMGNDVVLLKAGVGADGIVADVSDHNADALSVGGPGVGDLNAQLPVLVLWGGLAALA